MLLGILHDWFCNKSEHCVHNFIPSSDSVARRPTLPDAPKTVTFMAVVYLTNLHDNSEYTSYMSRTIIVWFRNDLRIHDHPALATASTDADQVIPVFILNSDILKGDRASSNRNRFLLESLTDLKNSLHELGADLVIRNGLAADELTKLAIENNADAVYYTADYTPYAIKRDKAVKASLAKHTVEYRSFAGRLIVSALDSLRTKSGNQHKVFTPFWKNWQQIGRREIATVPSKLSMPKNMNVGKLPVLSAITNKAELSPDVLSGGETAGRKRMHDFMDNDIAEYHNTSNIMSLAGTSRLSSYLHFGCISPLEAESLLPDNQGARSWGRQLAWRDFYNYILFNNPANLKLEYQEKYRALKWPQNKQLLTAWQQGKTGYPAVDAAMRQLNQEGWMHNRARLIVGSFLTKDLWIDWRDGEAYFMRMLIDGDNANNNGNWQWIASVGVDPAPVYRRLYNPSSQRDTYDPDGIYVRRFLPELKNVPDKYLSEPWTMPQDVQDESGCIIGKDYPKPIVDHKQARLFVLEQYRSVSIDSKLANQTV